MSSRIVYLRSKDGGPWEEIHPGPRSIVAWQLEQIRSDEVYDDGYGNRYRWELR